MPTVDLTPRLSRDSKPGAKHTILFDRLQALAAVYDQKLRRLQATAEKVLQDMAPGRLGLPAHVLDREQNLLAVPPHPKHDQQRD